MVQICHAHLLNSTWDPNSKDQIIVTYLSVYIEDMFDLVNHATFSNKVWNSPLFQLGLCWCLKGSIWLDTYKKKFEEMKKKVYNNYVDKW